MAGSLGELCVADPLRRDEDDDVEDGGAHREDAPQDGDRARVSARDLIDSRSKQKGTLIPTTPPLPAEDIS